LILLVDNYDSFTFNLRDYLLQLKLDCRVIRNDDRSLSDIELMNPSAIVFSPGPKTPSDAGQMMELIGRFHNSIPLLGICLGHQAIGEFFGAKLVKANKPMHGKTSEVIFEEHPLFKNLSNPFTVMRYHSLILDDVFNTPLKIIARTNQEEIMAIVHNTLPICGLQFHPESILTPVGLQILTNWKTWLKIH